MAFAVHCVNDLSFKKHVNVIILLGISLGLHQIEVITLYTPCFTVQL